MFGYAIKCFKKSKSVYNKSADFMWKLNLTRLSPAPHVATVAEAGACVHGLRPAASLLPAWFLWVCEFETFEDAFFSLTSNVCWPHSSTPRAEFRFCTVFLSIFPLTLHGMESPKPTFQIITKPLLMPSGSLMFPTWPPSFAIQVAVSWVAPSGVVQFTAYHEH